MIKKGYLPTKPSILRCLMLVGLIIVAYLLDSKLISAIVGLEVLDYVIKPIAWIGIFLLVFFSPKVRSRGKLRLKSFLSLWSTNFAVIYVVATFLAGLFMSSLARSPYNHSLLGIALNILMVGSVITGREMVRSYLVNSMTKIESYLTFIPIALFMAVISINYNQFADLTSYSSTIKFVAKYLGPEFAKSLLATYLAFLGGPVPSIVYMGITEGFNWLSPILPDLNWLTTAIIGILIPVFSLMAMQTIYASEVNILKPSHKNEEKTFSWIVTSIVSIFLIWFSVGVFPIYPAVILTGSMKPMIKPGDVTLVRRITSLEDLNKLKPGDVIQYSRANVTISHRIIKIVQEDNVKTFQTKGDNNSGPDPELVKLNQVKGEVVKVIPKIGLPSLLLRSKNDVDLKDVVF